MKNETSMKIGNLPVRQAGWKLKILVTFLLIGGGVLWFVNQAQGVNRTWDGGGIFFHWVGMI